MANKIIQIGQIDTSSANDGANYSLNVYKDVSMESIYVVDKFKVSKLVNAIAVKNSLKNIFTWIPGERILNPEFGSRLYMLLYEGITPLTEERIVAEIRHCVSEWEPRASIVNIYNASTIEDTEDNTIHIEVTFTINGLDDQQYSYSFTYRRDT